MSWWRRVRSTMYVHMKYNSIGIIISVCVNLKQLVGSLTARTGGPRKIKRNEWDMQTRKVCLRLAQLVRSLTANQEVLGSIPWSGWGLNFRRPSFATPSVDRDVKPLVYSIDVFSGDLKEPTHLSIRVNVTSYRRNCVTLHQNGIAWHNTKMSLFDFYTI